MTSPHRQTHSRLDPGLDAPVGAEPLRLTVVFELDLGRVLLAWNAVHSGRLVADGNIIANPATHFHRIYPLRWLQRQDGKTVGSNLSHWPASINALFKRLKALFPVPPGNLMMSVRSERAIGPLVAGEAFALPATGDPWRVLGKEIRDLAKLQSEQAVEKLTGDETTAGRVALMTWFCNRVHCAPPEGFAAPASRLAVTLNHSEDCILFQWTRLGKEAATGRVSVDEHLRLRWILNTGEGVQIQISKIDPAAIRAQLEKWRGIFPVSDSAISGHWLEQTAFDLKPQLRNEAPFSASDPAWPWIAENILAMGEMICRPERALKFNGKRLQKDRERAQALRERMERTAAERKRRQLAASKASKPKAEVTRPAPVVLAPAKERAPLPAVPIRLELPPLAFEPAAAPCPELSNYLLRERAAIWWVSNQSDDLLCLPHCRVQRLDYQVRTALRVLGPLRGRALLADEVGLGKTVEAGLVLKELLTRGMVKRYLILTVPSLVDQWEEELADKFNLATVTTNHAGARTDTKKFWSENPAVIASLHTLKQPAQLAEAREVPWDLLIVDEAHHLRNRDSLSWQAVNALPRQFLLLLTATPVQNSLEELYNLVTLLQPGQLPTPKEFRARFFDPKKPRQPKEPEELRRLLGQVMIRNTRANAGLNLPSRRAETGLFEPTAAERAFWSQWERELRSELAKLPGSQSSLWGRLLLQAAGSSPAAWREALLKFPGQAAARGWRENAPLEESWKRKCALLLPLTQGEGGVVIFTQFLRTQAALAEVLGQHDMETFVVNGSIPAAERQPITEAFRKRGGALILTQSGSEGRNLQFCHRLVNFDLPWNPMEIEQRIGRLHRLGQKNVVRIYNLVQADTLQEHLLNILQEKLNLFELVVGETGLILGEKFSSDEFAEEILRRWRDNEGRVHESLNQLGEELASARDAYGQVKDLDETLFAKDYESL